jgi:hypothetical protein
MIWVKVATFAFSIASLVIVVMSSRRINRAMKEIERINRREDLGADYYEKMTRPRKLTTLDEMKLRSLMRDPRQPFTGDPDDG